MALWKCNSHMEYYFSNEILVMFWWKILRRRQCISSKMFPIFHWNVSDVPVECLWCSARINISGACQMAVQNPVRYPASIFLIIPPSFFPRVGGKQKERLKREDVVTEFSSSSLWLVSEWAVGSKEALCRYHGLLSDARAHTHTRRGLQVQDPGMCLKWCSPAGAVRTWGTQQKHELHRDQRSEVIVLLSCEISSLDIDTHTY